MTEHSTSTYIPLYKRPEILEAAAEHQPAALKALRGEALELLNREGLPLTGSEDYKRFDLTGIVEQEHTLPFEAPIKLEDYQGKKHCTLTGLQTNSYCLLVEERPIADNKESGVFLGNLEEFEANHPGVAEKYLGTMQSVRKDALSAYNTFLSQAVTVLYISKGTVVEDPIHMVRLSGIEEGADRWSSPRLLIIVEEESQARLLSCDHAKNADSFVSNTVVEIYAEKNSRFEFYDLEDTSSSSIRIHTLHVSQAENSYVDIHSLTIQNGQTRNNFFADLKGAHAELYLNGICILDDRQKADTHSFIRHSVSGCHSDEIFKYTLNDNAVGSFSGKIYVAKDAQQTTAYQNNRNLLLSSKAKMYSKPHLEIYADDVKCSHGMTTGELDNDALFYMQQRGIPYVEAKLLLTIAFMSEVLEKIQLVPLRERLIQAVENRYRGLSGFCQKQP